MSLYNTWPFSSSFFQKFKTVSRTPLHAPVCHSFSLLSNSPLDGYTTCIHSLADGHLCCFCFWFVNNVALPHSHLSLCIKIWLLFISPVIYLGVELLGHMIILLLTFWGIARLFQWGSTYLHPHQQCMSAYILAKTRFVYLLIMVLGKRKQFPLCSCVFENDYMY